MAEMSIPARDSVAAQREMLRLAERDHGLSIAVLAKRSPLKASTIKGWRDGAAMPAWALGALGEAGVPDHLLSLVLEPFARCVVTDDDDGGDLDTAALDAADFSNEVLRARSPSSPGGSAIVPQELLVIEPKMQRARSSMRRAA